MATTPSEIVKTIQSFPVSVQEEIIKSVQENLQNAADYKKPSEDEIEQMLLAKGLISQIPTRTDDPEEETYEPIKIKGNPLSETILEERE